MKRDMEGAFQNGKGVYRESEKEVQRRERQRHTIFGEWRALIFNIRKEVTRKGVKERDAARNGAGKALTSYS